MTDPHPRYVCLHYDVARRDGHAEPEISYILDAWYCYAHVGRYAGLHKRWVRGSGLVRERARVRAERQAAAWNAEHDAWLAADPGEAAQATKGKGSR